MFVATVLAWISWVLVLIIIDPSKTAWWGFVLFYVTLFLSLFGSFSVVGFTIRALVQIRRRVVTRKASDSLRQAFLWSLALVIALGLQSQRLLTWWVIVLVILTFSAIEFIILSLKYSTEEQA